MNGICKQTRARRYGSLGCYGLWMSAAVHWHAVLRWNWCWLATQIGSVIWRCILQDRCTATLVWRTTCFTENSAVLSRVSQRRRNLFIWDGTFRPSFKTGTKLSSKFSPTFWTHIVGGEGHIVQSASKTRGLLLSSISLLATDSRGTTDWSQDEADSSGQLWLRYSGQKAMAAEFRTRALSCSSQYFPRPLAGKAKNPLPIASLSPSGKGAHPFRSTFYSFWRLWG